MRGRETEDWKSVGDFGVPYSAGEIKYLPYSVPYVGLSQF